MKAGMRRVICGSGKSTLIRCINRLEKHEAGVITIDGIVIDDRAAGRQALRNNVGMVFQQFNLFPHLTILQNLTLGPMRARKLPAAEARDLAIHYLERVFKRTQWKELFKSWQVIIQNGYKYFSIRTISL